MRYRLRTLMIVLAFTVFWTAVFLWLSLAFNDTIYWPVIPLALLAAMLSGQLLPGYSPR